MSFDFFNPSNLAFGSKLTAVFTQLNNLTDAAEESLERVFEIQDFINQYYQRSYVVPKPVRKNGACRVDEIFDLLNDVGCIVNKMEYDKTTETLSIDLNLFNRSNNRMTKSTGSTTLKEGYCYCKRAISNTNPQRNLSFDTDIRYDLGELLFQYRIDSSGNINIVGDLSNICSYPSDGNIYTSISKGATLQFTGGEYTAKDYECVCLVGNYNNIQVILNNRVILQGYGENNIRHCILYLKPNDVVKGSIAKGFRINYNT